MSAVNLSSLAPIIQAQRGLIIGIGLELEDVDDFLEETKWAFDLLIDEAHAVYAALNLKKHGCSSCWGVCICCTSVGTWVNKARGLGYSSNASGNWTQYGGTFLLRGGDGAALYVHKQVDDDFEPDLDVILERLGQSKSPERIQYPARMK